MMPRYFFDIDDGKHLTQDDVGLVLSDIADARYQAIAGLTDIAKEESLEGDYRIFSAFIRDKDDRLICKAALTLQYTVSDVVALGEPSTQMKQAPTNISFFQIAEMANDVVIVTTPDLKSPGPRILYVNAAYTRLTGYSSEETLSLSPRMLQGPGTSRATRDKIGLALKDGRDIHEKILNYSKSGAPYWLDLRIFALRDAVGNITHFVAIERDVTMDKRRLDELECVADRDTLTGIPNRRALIRTIGSEIEDFRSRGGIDFGAAAPSLAFIAVDHFKSINDRLGHAVGDAVLFGMADRLAENVRRSDTVGRLGGEEFVVFMPAVTLRDASALAERLRRAIASAPFETLSGPMAITVSIGVAALSEGDDLTTLIERADAAMYLAKLAGGGRVKTRSPETATAGR
jgi:diguanylate cyclase (GGDEF)-like protein/PAS domain S-box-containing protein